MAVAAQTHRPGDGPDLPLTTKARCLLAHFPGGHPVREWLAVLSIKGTRLGPQVPALLRLSEALYMSETCETSAGSPEPAHRTPGPARSGRLGRGQPPGRRASRKPLRQRRQVSRDENVKQTVFPGSGARGGTRPVCPQAAAKGKV